MARTFGKRFRRYVGHKLYLAEIAARKASLVVDNGRDVDLQPFWMDAPCCCMLVTCDECGEEARFWAQEAEHRAAWEASHAYRPEPPSSYTGRMIAVEWEAESGYRYWEIIDEGQLSREVWLAAQSGTSLSDVDEPAEGIAA